MTVADLLRELIRIPSVNPDGDPGIKHTGEKNARSSLRDFLRSCGAEAWLEDVLPDRPNVLGRFPSAGKAKPRLLFAPHTDTVSVAGMSIDPFSGELHDGKIWGRGASDTKGPMAAMLFALLESKDLLPHLSQRSGLRDSWGRRPASKAPELSPVKKNLILPLLVNPRACRRSIRTKDQSG